MPRDVNGNYSLPPGYQAVTGETILASQHNPPLEDIAASLTGSLARSGAASMLGALAMGGFRITGLANASADQDAVTLAQVVSLITAAAIPPGIVSAFHGIVPPVGWLMLEGQTLNRALEAPLFAATCPAFTGSLTSGNVFIGTPSLNFQNEGIIGAKVEGVGIQPGTTIVAATPTLLTISLPVTTTTASAALRIFPFGNGDGSTTFQLANPRGEFIRALDRGRGVDAARNLGSFQSGMIESHGHTASASNVDPLDLYHVPEALEVGGGFPKQNITVASSAYTIRSANHGHSITVFATGGAETRPRNIALNYIIKR